MTTHDPQAPASADAALENRLRALPKAPGPDPRFRDELRVQLVAAAERGPELTNSDEITAAGARAASRRRLRVRFSLPFGLPAPGQRAYAIAGAALAVLLVVTGTTYWLAQRALPGDALYGLKRAGESVDLSTKQGDQSRGDAYLAISTTRIDEAAALVKRATSAGIPGPTHVPTRITASGPLSPYIDGLVHGVLVAGDTAAVTATRLLTEASVAKRASHPAAAVNGWLTDQRSKVKGLVARLPETGTNTAGGAARMLQRDLNTIHARIKALTAGLGCRACRFAISDRFGPLPCRVCPRPTPSTPRRPTPSSSSSPQPTSATPTLPSVLPSGVGTSTSIGLVPPTTGTGPTDGSTAPTSGVPPTEPPPSSPPTSPPTSPPSSPPTSPPSSPPTSPTDGPTVSPTTPDLTDGSSSGPTDPTLIPVS